MGEEGEGGAEGAAGGAGKVSGSKRKGGPMSSQYAKRMKRLLEAGDQNDQNKLSSMFLKAANTRASVGPSMVKEEKKIAKTIAPPDADVDDLISSLGGTLSHCSTFLI